MAERRRVPGWVVGAGWGVLGVSAVGLPVALVVAGLDAVRRSGDVAGQRIVLGALVVLAVAFVVGVERGLTYTARESGVLTALGAAAGVVAVVLLGLVVPGLGIVLVALGVVLGVPLLLAGTGYLAYWRWQHGPRPTLPPRASQDEVRARAEARRAAVRARHALTVEAVRRGLIGPGFRDGG